MRSYVGTRVEGPFT